MTRSRRSFLRIAALATTGLAGCSGSENSTRATTTSQRTTSASPETTTPDLEGTTSETETATKPSNAPNSFAWLYHVGRDVQFPPAVTEDAVYVPSDDLYALAPDGSERWVAATETEVSSSPLVRDAVYFTRPDAVQTVGFDGTPRWSTDSFDGSPYLLDVTDESAYVGTVGHLESPRGWKTSALDTKTGRVEWRVETGGRSDGIVSNGNLYVASPNRVLAISIDDGSVLWETNVESSTGVLAGLTNSTLLAQGDAVYALSTDDGSIEWTFGTGENRDEESYVTDVTFVDDTAYVAADDSVRALDVADGSVKWRYEVGQSSSVSAVTEDTLYVVGGTGGAEVHALNVASGERKWFWRDDGRVYDVRSTADSLFVRGESTLRALSSEGVVRWQFDAGLELSPMTVTEHGVYVGTRASSDGTETEENAVPGALYAFDLNN